MRIFISAPYTIGDALNNVVKVIDVAEKLVQKGHTPFVPHLYHFWDTLYPHPREFWLKLDLEWMKSCDALFRMEGASTGADLEVIQAGRLGLTIYHTLESIPSCLK